MKITVNKQVFDEKICMYQLQRMSQKIPNISEKDAKKKVADTIIRHALLKEYSKKEIDSVPTKQVDHEFDSFKRSYPNEAEFKKMCQMSHTTEEKIKKDIEESIRIDLFVQKLSKDIPPPPKKIIEEYYKKDSAISKKPKEIHAAHIVKKVTPPTAAATYKEMCDIRKQLLDGADFAEMADKHSSCNDAGGDLGFFPRGKMVEEFDVIAFSMNPGEISPIFQTQFGYHILTVYEVKEEGRLFLEECEDRIKQAIKVKMREDCVNKWLEKVKPDAEINIEE